MMVTMSSLELDGRPIKLDLADANSDKHNNAKTIDTENKLFIGNLNFETTEADVRILVEEKVGAGSLLRVDFIFDKVTSELFS